MIFDKLRLLGRLLGSGREKLITLITTPENYRTNGLDSNLQFIYQIYNYLKIQENRNITEVWAVAEWRQQGLEDRRWKSLKTGIIAI